MTILYVSATVSVLSMLISMGCAIDTALTLHQIRKARS